MPKGNRSLLEISQNIRSVHDDDNNYRSRSHDPAAISEETNRKLKRHVVDAERRTRSIGPTTSPNKRQYVSKYRENYDKENKTFIELSGHNSRNSRNSRNEFDKQVRFDESFGDSNSPRLVDTSTPNTTGTVYNSDGHHYIVRNVNKRPSPAMQMIADDHVNPVDSPNKPKGHSVNHQDRVNKARTRARMWQETNSDPGPYIPKSIHNDNVIRGRPTDHRSGRGPYNDGTRGKHFQVLHSTSNGGPRHDPRPKGAERGRRQQSNPIRREATDSDQRPTNSAPAKEQGSQEVPRPRINNLITNGYHSPTKPIKIKIETNERITKPSDSRTTAKPDARKESKDEVKPETKGDTRARNKPDVHVRDAAGTTTHDQDSKRNIKFATSTSGTPTKDTQKEKTDVKAGLPADDHGAVDKSKSTKTSQDKMDNKSQKPQNELNYYASAAKKMAPQEENQKKEKTEVPPLRLHSEKSQKNDKVVGSNLKNESPHKHERSKTVDRSHTPTTDYSDKSKKRKEVTIIDPAEVRKTNEDMSKDDDEDTFPKEFEYRTPGERHTKKFEEMSDEEKVDYFKNHLKLHPDQIRELTFHPKVTVPKQIHRAYTGVDTVGWASPRVASGRRPKSRTAFKGVYKKVKTVVPHKRKSFLFSKLQGVVYRHINKVYGYSPRQNREQHFFSKLAQVQIDEYERRYQMLEERERKRLESKFRQRSQLKQLRRRFEDDAWRRFMTQYVTSKVVEAEYRDREEYGLPNDLNSSSSSNFNQRRRKGHVMTPRRRARVNKKKYSSIFTYTSGPEWKVSGKPMKFEGFDEVELETEDEQDKTDGFDDVQQGRPIKKRQDVDALMREAKRLLDQSDEEYTDVDDEPTYSTSRRTVTRRPQNRPSHGRSRSERSESERSRSKERSKSQSRKKTPPKTMKELYDSRQNKTQQNRYRVSEFKDMKADLLKGSVELNKMEEKRQKTASSSDKNSDKNREESVTSKVENSQTREAAVNMKDNEPIRNMRTPESPVKGQRSSDKKTNNEGQIKQTGNEPDNNRKRKLSVDKKKSYLDEPETQMAIDNAKDSPQEGSKSPTKSNNSSETQTKTETSTEIVRVVEKPKTVVTSSNVNINGSTPTQNGQSKQITTDVTSSRVSIKPHITSVQNTRKQSTDVSSSRATLKPTTPNQNGNTRTPSRASVRVPSRASIRAPSRASVSPQRRMSKTSVQIKSDSQKEVERKAIVGSEATLREPQITNHNGITNGEQSSPENRESPAKNDVVKHQEEKVEVKTTTIDNRSKTEPVTHNSTADSKRHTPEKTAAERDKSRTHAQNESPKLNGYRSPSSDKQKTNTQQHNNINQPIISKTKHVSEDNRETVSDKRGPKVIRARQGKPSLRGKVENDPSVITKQLTTNDRRTHPSKSKTEAGQSRSRSHTPNRGRGSNASRFTDSRMSRDDYERKDSRQRPKDRKRSTSRERKRSTSRDKKRSQQQNGSKSRFPNIERRDGRLSVVPVSSPDKNRKVNVTEEETTQEIEVGKPAGAKQWKDLVSKYLRQPSPKVGKTEDRAVMETNLETDDDDDDEIDIFERARKRYLLNVSDDDSDEE